MNPNTTTLSAAEYVAILGTLELVQLYHSFRGRPDGAAPAWAELARRRLAEIHGPAFVAALDRDADDRRSENSPRGR